MNCGAETSNGLALCELCQGKGQLDLVYIPIYFRNLARWKPGRAGSRPVPGSRVLYDGADRGIGTGDRISDRLDEITTSLTTWARALTADRPHFPRPLTFADAVLTGDFSDETAEQLSDDPARAIAGLCTALGLHMTSVATLDWCGELVRDLSAHEAVLRGLTETTIPGWYAGSCRRCEAPTYVVPGLTWVTCRGCGSTTYARDHLEIVLDEARDWVAPPKAIAQAIVALVDTEQSVPRLHERIKKWEQRERLTPVQRIEREYEWSDAEERIVIVAQPAGRKRYRMGEVLNLVLIKTRAADAVTDAS